jgi:hypothetical protein
MPTDFGDFAGAALADGLTLGFLTLFFCAVLFGFVGWMKGMLG